MSIIPSLAPLATSLRPHPHCGPFNKITEPSGPVDAICCAHDRAYEEMGPKAYFVHSAADDAFISSMDSEGGFLPTIYSAVFKMRRSVLPRANENLANYLPFSQDMKRNQAPLRPGNSSALTSRTSKAVRAPAAISFSTRSAGGSGAKRRVTGDEPALSNITVNTMTPVFINPGDQLTFPILYQEARMRLRYKYHSLILRYRPSCGTDSTGDIGIAWIDDPSTPVPTTLEELLSTAHHVVGPVWEPKNLAIPRNPIDGGRNNYLISQSAEENPNLHAPGYFVVFSELANSGRFQISYDITFFGRNPYPMSMATNNFATWIPLHGAQTYFDGNTSISGGNDFAGSMTSGASKTPFIRVASNYDMHVLRPGFYQYSITGSITEGSGANHDAAVSVYVNGTLYHNDYHEASEDFFLEANHAHAFHTNGRIRVDMVHLSTTGYAVISVRMGTGAAATITDSFSLMLRPIELS